MICVLFILVIKGFQQLSLSPFSNKVLPAIKGFNQQCSLPTRITKRLIYLTITYYNFLQHYFLPARKTNQILHHSVLAIKGFQYLLTCGLTNYFPFSPSWELCITPMGLEFTCCLLSLNDRALCVLLKLSRLVGTYNT